MKHDFWFHALHESGHALRGWQLGLTPVWLSIRRKRVIGTTGGINFAERVDTIFEEERTNFLHIGVAGQVATRIFGYTNTLVSEQLERFYELQASDPWCNPVDTLGDESDAYKIYEANFDLETVQFVEDLVGMWLRKERAKLEALARELVLRGELRRKRILAILSL
jgi:hypothetical protein